MLIYTRNPHHKVFTACSFLKNLHNSINSSINVIINFAYMLSPKPKHLYLNGQADADTCP